jgi:hypothetical protein
VKNRRKPLVSPVPKSAAVDQSAVGGCLRPVSATHPLIALSGLAAFFAGIVVLSLLRPFQMVAYDAALLILVIALGVFVPDMLWRRVWRNPSAGLDA